jgi:CRISPR-associated protein Cas6
MYWQEDEDTSVATLTVTDVFFRVNARSLPGDHAMLLWQALCCQCPELADSPVALHTVWVPQEGNGWFRDDNSALFLPRRARFGLRLPADQVEGIIAALDGQPLSLDDTYSIQPSHPDTKPLGSCATLWAHHVAVADLGMDEPAFLQGIAQELSRIGVRAPKMISGKEYNVLSFSGKVVTRSVLLDGVTARDSLLLQQQGIGAMQHLGCGVFVPHKRVTN